MLSEDFPEMNEELNAYIKKANCIPRKTDLDWGKEWLKNTITKLKHGKTQRL